MSRDTSVFEPIIKPILQKNLNQTLDISSVIFPIPWNFTITCKGGQFQVNNPIKLLGGSTLIVDKGASLINNSKIIIYDDSLSTDGTKTPMYSDTKFSECIYPYSKGIAKLINNGTLTLSNNSSFRGNIKSEVADSKIIVNSNADLEFESHEGKGNYSISGTSINFTFEDYAGSPIKKVTNIDLLDSTSSTVTHTKLSTNTTYTSIQINSEIVWKQ